MRRLVLSIIVGVVFFSCDRGPRMIPENVLKDMIEEIMITDAVLTQINAVSVSDSTDYYRPVLDKYGYELRDIEYTFKQLASRQSMPLSNIYELIQADLNDMAAAVKYNYSRREALDNLAMLCYTDTIFSRNDTIAGKMGDFRAVVVNPQKGKYHFTFMYQGVREYNIPLRKAVGILTFKDKSQKSINNTSWVSRSFQPNMIRLMVNVSDSVSYDSILFKIEDPDFSGTRFSLKSDSSRAYDFRVVYIPERNDARNAYFKKVTGMDFSTLISRYQLQYEVNKKDSSSVWPFPRR